MQLSRIIALFDLEVDVEVIDQGDRRRPFRTTWTMVRREASPASMGMETRRTVAFSASPSPLHRHHLTIPVRPAPAPAARPRAGSAVPLSWGGSPAACSRRRMALVPTRPKTSTGLVRPLTAAARGRPGSPLTPLTRRRVSRRSAGRLPRGATFPLGRGTWSADGASTWRSLPEPYHHPSRD